MKRKHFIIGLGLALLAALLLLLWPKNPGPRQAERDFLPSGEQSASQPEIPPAALEEADQERRSLVVEAVESMLNTPITFYGKVIDQHGDPVPNARVGYSLLDKFNESGSNAHTYADNDGHINISGVKGAVLGVSVSKEGYYKIHNVSNQRFAYGYGTDSSVKPAPTRDNPAVFILHKMGEMESLIRLENPSFRLRKDGTPVIVDLATGRESSAGQFKVQAWTGERIPDGPRFYDWRCRVSVPGGGLVERRGELDFEAPVEGYREFDEIVMPKDAERWTKDVKKSYFIRLPDGRHARISFSFTSGGYHYFRIDSYLNPKPGSRNLEYDPAKRVKP